MLDLRVNYEVYRNDYDSLIESQEMVNDMLDSVNGDKIIDNRTDDFVASLSLVMLATSLQVRYLTGIEVIL